MAIQSFFSLSYCGHAKRKKYREFIVFPSCNLASYIHTYFYKESTKEDITLINLTKILLKDCSNFLKILRLSRRLFNMVSYLTIQWVENNSEGVFLSSCNNFHKIFLDFSQQSPHGFTDSKPQITLKFEFFLFCSFKQADVIDGKICENNEVEQLNCSTNVWKLQYSIQASGKNTIAWK